jgi:alanyl-tRNA synthetase
VTTRLYYDDSYLREFQARVTGREGERVYLDRTAFYPSSGGQPFDTGAIGGVRVVEVIDEDGRIGHVVAGEVAEAEAVLCAVDWGRRFDHMQQHTGQHLLSGVLHQEHGIETVSFHLGAESSTIDLNAERLDAERLEAVERRANELVCENRAVTVSYHAAGEDAGLRKETEREGTLRVVTIAELDRSACGGTHVRATGEIGAILLRKVDKMRGNVRLEFVCGGRAIRRARADFEALSRIARTFSAAAAEAPGLVAAQAERLAESDKQRRRLATELAQSRGRELHAATEGNGQGLRVQVRRLEQIEEDVRAEAQAFCGCGKAVYLAGAEQTGALLLAASADSGLHAGAALKQVVDRRGGRGGGGPTLAQGSVEAEQVAAVLEELRRLTGQG